MRTGWSVEIRLEQWEAPDTQAERDSGICTRRERHRAHYNGSLSETDAADLFEKLDRAVTDFIPTPRQRADGAEQP